MPTEDNLFDIQSRFTESDKKITKKQVEANSIYLSEDGLFFVNNEKKARLLDIDAWKLISNCEGILKVKPVEENFIDYP
jgi:hypothetical protein